MSISDRTKEILNLIKNADDIEFDGQPRVHFYTDGERLTLDIHEVSKRLQSPATGFEYEASLRQRQDIRSSAEYHKARSQFETDRCECCGALKSEISKFIRDQRWPVAYGEYLSLPLYAHHIDPEAVTDYAQLSDKTAVNVCRSCHLIYYHRPLIYEYLFGEIAPQDLASDVTYRQIGALFGYRPRKR